MPTIKIRRPADGATRYTAIVRLRRQGTILHRESRTFPAPIPSQLFAGLTTCDIEDLDTEYPPSKDL